MENSILEKVAKLLTSEEGDLNSEVKKSAQFFNTDELTPEDIKIEVDGLGLMSFPVYKQYIKKLIDMSSKAQFGLRDQTILDENIRNSYEIKADKLHVSINEQSLTSMLSKMRDNLGLSENSALTAHLHNMLIYGPGQFFDMHQDTEKLENMVATLVVVLPSAHIGGDLIIAHGERQYVFSSENIDPSNAKCICFYADCYHKIEKIKQGYRIALVYNVVLKSEELCSTQVVNQQLAEAIKEYFESEKDKQLQREQPPKLVYFLSHSYSEFGLLMNMLKGTDRANAFALLRVAKELGLFLHLALVKIHKSWLTDGDYHDPSLYELAQPETVTLSFWIDSNNEKISFSECKVYDHEICLTKETDEFDPYKKEYEGYMGNYGDTMDHWYRRAAVVLWPKSSQILVNFMLNYDNALNDLYVLTSSLGNEHEVLETIAKSGRYLHRERNTNENSDFAKLANIALYIKDKDTALSILSHFKWQILDSDIMKLFFLMQTQYGVSWCIDLLNSWKNRDAYNKAGVLNEIYSFAQAFLCYGGETAIVKLLLDTQTDALIYRDTEAYKWQKHVHLKDTLPKRTDAVYETLATSALIQNIPVLDRVIEHLISNPELYPETSLAELYFKLKDEIPPEYFSNCKLLKSYLVKTINNNVAFGMRSSDDWSIQAKWPCNCENCEEVTSFLHSRTAIKKIWPIPERTRRHVIYKFDCLDLPVDVSVESIGRPYRLIMVKTGMLHQNARKQFDEYKFYQEKLQNCL